MTKQYVVKPLEGFHPEIGRMLWMLEDTRRITRNELASVDARTIDLRGGLNDHSIGSLLFHIAAIEISWLAEEVAVDMPLPADLWDHFPFDVRDDRGHLTLVTGLSSEEHWQRLDYTRNLLLEVYKGLTIEDYRRPRHFEAYDVTPEWVLYHLIEHETGHREEMCNMREGWQKQT